MKSIYNHYKNSYINISKTCWTQLLCYFLHTLSTGFCFYISFHLVTNLHLSVFISGLLISIYGIGTTLGGIIGGKICDQFGCRLTLIISLLLKAMAFACLLFATSPLALAPILFILGFTNYAFITASNTYTLAITEQSESSRLSMINLFNIISNLGLGISALTMSLLIKDVNAIFMFATLTLTGLAFYYFKQPINVKTSHNIINNNDETLTHSTKKQAIFYTTLMCVFLTGLTVSQWRITYVAYMHTVYTSINTHMIGFILALNPVIVVLFQNLVVSQFENKNKLLSMGLGGFLIGFGMLLLSAGTSLWLAIIACITYTLGEMIFFAMAQLLCYQNNPAHKKGRATGWFKSTYALSTIIGPSAGGFLFHHYNPNAIWYVSGIIGIAVIALCSLTYQAFSSHQSQYTPEQMGHPQQT